MPPTTAKSLMKDFRASFRRKKGDTVSKEEKLRKQEEEEQKKLSELKEILSKEATLKYTDCELLGFLRARALNVEEAEELVNVNTSMRKLLQFEEFVKNYKLSEFDKKYRISAVLGTDKEGSVVRVINIFSADLKGFLQAYSTIENFRVANWFLEKDLMLQDEENKKNGKTNRQLTYIINIENISFSKITYKPAFDTIMLSIKLLQDHYHDVPKAVYIVNAPSFFPAVFKMLRAVIGESLHQKIKVFENNGQEELLKVIDADILPACFGGKRTDPDGSPLCLDLIGRGGKVSESYLSFDSLVPDDPEVTTVTIPAGSSLYFKFKVPQIGTRIAWHLLSKDNDICIGVFYKPFSEDDDDFEDDRKWTEDEDESTLERLTPTIRTQCHIRPEIGSTVSWFSGIIVFHIDNTYSWMNAKEIMFKLTIEPPTKGYVEGKKPTEC